MLIKSLIFAFVICLSIGNCISAIPSEEVIRKLCPTMANAKQPADRVDTSARIVRLREEMRSTRAVQGPALDAYIITRYDEHMNEYVNDHDKRLEYMTGYKGNIGLAIVTRNKTVFWTDKLHYQLADRQLSCDWTLIKTGPNGGIAAATEWLSREFQSGMRVGADPKLVPNSDWETISNSVSRSSSSRSIILVPVVQNLIDLIWPDEERPPEMNSTAFVWPESYAGKTWREKLNTTRELLKKVDVDALVLTSLAEIAWLLNIRASDLPYAPFLKAYAIVAKDQLHLYTSLEKLTNEVHSHLNTATCVSSYCARLHEYETVWSDLRKLSLVWKRILLPSSSHYSAGVSRHIFISVNAEKRKAMPSPLIGQMAIKNDDEIASMRRAYARDAVLLSNFSSFIESELQKSTDTLDELSLVNSTYLFRFDSNADFKGDSYPVTIASGSNTAMPLYVPANATNKIIDKRSMFIIDCGSQYLDGTTSTARTFYSDANSIPYKYVEIYTRVLAGLINVAALSFPQQLTTSQLDIIARIELWEMGLDYPQGSGHGIGVFSNVYESPIDINSQNGLNDTLKASYLVLVETGYYQEDEFGMKLSSVFEVVPKNDSSGYLSFDPVTLFPFEHTLINYTLLSVRQKMWLNAYNERIRSTVGEALRKEGLNNAYNWIFDRTKEIETDDSTSDENGAISIKRNFILILIFAVFVTRFATVTSTIRIR